MSAIKRRRRGDLEDFEWNRFLTPVAQAIQLRNFFNNSYRDIAKHLKCDLTNNNVSHEWAGMVATVLMQVQVFKEAFVGRSKHLPKVFTGLKSYHFEIMDKSASIEFGKLGSSKLVSEKKASDADLLQFKAYLDKLYPYALLVEDFSRFLEDIESSAQQFKYARLLEFQNHLSETCGELGLSIMIARIIVETELANRQNPETQYMDAMIHLGIAQMFVNVIMNHLCLILPANTHRECLENQVINQFCEQFRDTLNSLEEKLKPYRLIPQDVCFFPVIVPGVPGSSSDPTPISAPAPSPAPVLAPLSVFELPEPEPLTNPLDLLSEMGMSYSAATVASNAVCGAINKEIQHFTPKVPLVGEPLEPKPEPDFKFDLVNCKIMTRGQYEKEIAEEEKYLREMLSPDLFPHTVLPLSSDLPLSSELEEPRAVSEPGEFGFVSRSTPPLKPSVFSPVTICNNSVSPEVGSDSSGMGLSPVSDVDEAFVFKPIDRSKSTLGLTDSDPGFLDNFLEACGGSLLI